MQKKSSRAFIKDEARYAQLSTRIDKLNTEGDSHLVISVHA